MTVFRLISTPVPSLPGAQVDCKTTSNAGTRFELIKKKKGNQYRVAGANLCLQKRGGTRIALRPCSNSLHQLFKSTRGREGSFDLRPAKYNSRCLTNHHHPKAGEVSCSLPLPVAYSRLLFPASLIIISFLNRSSSLKAARKLIVPRLDIGFSTEQREIVLRDVDSMGAENCLNFCVTRKKL